MHKTIAGILIFLYIFYNLGWAQIELPYPPLNLVSIPTAGVLPSGSFTLESLLTKNGGLVPRLSVGFTDNFSFGVSFGVSFGDLVWVLCGFCLFCHHCMTTIANFDFFPFSWVT